ncbi:hypothetical protein F1559_000463 [Cyanidiococcus yangmingshanensis]|uniref:C3H1-type domain-containing protein n=1 Tax=Cyanidiococcus yangmingshanensis TaxID=2690220 RepID=A0A7J7IGL1_9RHOD|nr:hypothetical protein F1559_000463 [Cyanidiococcus yangmingshanensis]
MERIAGRTERSNIKMGERPELGRSEVPPMDQSQVKEDASNLASVAEKEVVTGELANPSVRLVGEHHQDGVLEPCLMLQTETTSAATFSVLSKSKGSAENRNIDAGRKRVRRTPVHEQDAHAAELGFGTKQQAPSVDSVQINLDDRPEMESVQTSATDDLAPAQTSEGTAGAKSTNAFAGVAATSMPSSDSLLSATQSVADGSVLSRVSPTTRNEATDPRSSKPVALTLRSALKDPKRIPETQSKMNPRRASKRVHFAPEPALVQMHVFEWIPDERTHAPVNIAGLATDEDGSPAHLSKTTTGSGTDRASITTGGAFSEVVEEGRLMQHMRQRRRKALDDMHEDASFYPPPRVQDAPLLTTSETEPLANRLSIESQATESNARMGTGQSLVGNVPSGSLVSPEEPSRSVQYEDEKQPSLGAYRVIPERRVVNSTHAPTPLPQPSANLVEYSFGQPASTQAYVQGSTDRSFPTGPERQGSNVPGASAVRFGTNDIADTDGTRTAEMDAAILQHFLSLNDEEERLQLLNDARVLRIVQQYAEEKQREAQFQSRLTTPDSLQVSSTMYSPLASAVNLTNIHPSVYASMSGDLLTQPGYPGFIPTSFPYPEAPRGGPNTPSVCKYYLQGRCRYRDKCRFWHPPAPT